MEKLTRNFKEKADEVTRLRILGSKSDCEAADQWIARLSPTKQNYANRLLFWRIERTLRVKLV